MRTVRLVCATALLFSAAGCRVSESLENAARNITLNTPDPIKVDMKITLDVYQHDADKKEPEKDKDREKADADAAELNRRLYNRQKEIQDLKNQRLVAETHRGLLFLREQPAGAYGEYVRETVEKENSDRRDLMIDEAARTRRELHDIEKERWNAAVKNAFPGEYIEVADPDRPDAYKIVQKVKP